MPVFLAVAAGGALGSLSRYVVDRLIERRVASVFPWSVRSTAPPDWLAFGIFRCSGSRSSR